MTDRSLLAVVAGALIGLSLGALGGGGSILAVPVLLRARARPRRRPPPGPWSSWASPPWRAPSTAYRAGNVLLARGVAFGLVAIAGAVAGAHASAAVPEAVLLAAFAGLMLVVGRPDDGPAGAQPARRARGRHADRPRLDDPIITFSPTLLCQCPRALKVLVTATVVGLLTGFLGVGGGFLVVPALVLALALPMGYAAGTSLVVITITSTAALAARAGTGIAPDWWLVAALTVTAIGGSIAGARSPHAPTPADFRPPSPAWSSPSPPTPPRPPYPPSSDPTTPPTQKRVPLMTSTATRRNAHTRPDADPYGVGYRPGPLGRLGLWVTHHRKATALVWLLLVLGLGAFAPKVEANLSGAGWQADGSESVAVRELATKQFGGNASSAIQVVIHCTDGPVTEGAGTDVLDEVTAHP